MKSNFKMRLLCSILALSLLMTGCATANGHGTETASNNMEDTQEVTVQQENTEVVGSAVENTQGTENTEDSIPVTNTAEPELSPEEQEWQDKVMAKVEDSLNVREKADGESEVVGLLAAGDRATVLEAGEEWTKISSGNVVGYIKNDYCVYGTEALTYAKSICETVATSNTDGLNVRAEMNTDCEVVNQLAKGDKIVVDTDATVSDGWVAVISNGETAYVSAEFVSISLNLGTALTMDEIYEIQRAEEEAKRKEEEDRKQDYDDKNDYDEDDDDGGYGHITINDELVKNASDLEILAAIIHCESRGEPYDAQLGVGAVVINRTKSGIFPGSIKKVIFQSGQFTPVYDGSLEKALSTMNLYSSCWKAAKAALAGEDNTDGCLYFNNYNGSREGLRYGRMVFWKKW